MDGQLDDYAFYCWALLELYEANFSVSCLREAAGLAGRMEQLFWDGTDGGFYRTASNGERLIARQKEAADSGTPSGNGAAALALVRLARLTGEPRFRLLAQKQLAWLAGEAKGYPAARCFALLAMADELYPAKGLVCVTAGEVPSWLAGVGESYRLSTLAKTLDNSRGLARLVPFTADYPIPKAGERLYLCRDGACAPPADSLEGLRKLLQAEVPV